MNYPEPIAKLIESYMKLPGIGQKTATRLAFYTIDMKEEDANAFAKALISVKRDLHFCSICGNITEEDPCEICQDKNRDRSIILVVEEPKDVMAMEKMREYQGLYHVLHGVLSPMEGTGPEDSRRTSRNLKETSLEKEVEIEVGRFCEKMSQFKLFRTSFSVSFFQRMHHFK